MQPVATILLSIPDESPRLVLTALLEALGHDVVEQPVAHVDAAVIEPGYSSALGLVRRISAERG